MSSGVSRIQNDFEGGVPTFADRMPSGSAGRTLCAGASMAAAPVCAPEPMILRATRATSTGAWKLKDNAQVMKRPHWGDVPRGMRARPTWPAPRCRKMLQVRETRHRGDPL